VSANARRRKRMMELLLDRCFLWAWDPVLRGRINKVLGENSHWKCKAILLEL